MKANFLFTIILVTIIFQSYAQRITVSGNKFLVNGKEIIMNGANTPWNRWNDFGGNYNSSWWDAEFKRIKDAGGNSTRIWISCDGEVGLNIQEDGTVTGATNAFWSHLDDMFRLAEKNRIYIKATLTSFDHFKNSHPKYQRWRNMITNDDKVSSFIDNYVNPFVAKYKNNPYLWSIDVCNEIEWVNQNAECGKIPWARLQYFVARVASAVHDSSQVLVTLGSAAIKWNSSRYEGNFWSDAALKAQYNKPNAVLDFYSPHYYGWTVQWFGNFAVDKSPADYGINDRPCVIGENPARGVFNDAANPKLVTPASQMFIGAYKKGWKGVMPWTSNGVDANGTLNDFKDGLLAFKEAYPELINPSIVSGMAPRADKPKFSLIENVHRDPVNKQLAVRLSDYGNVILSLTDSMGRVVYRRNMVESDTVVPTGSLSSGIYILAVNNNGMIETRKIILN